MPRSDSNIWLTTNLLQYLNWRLLANSRAAFCQENYMNCWSMSHGIFTLSLSLFLHVILCIYCINAADGDKFSALQNKSHLVQMALSEFKRTLSLHTCFSNRIWKLLISDLSSIRGSQTITFVENAWKFHKYNGNMLSKYISLKNLSLLCKLWTFKQTWILLIAGVCQPRERLLQIMC